jgi:mono/diheme cytochrome c family protein
VVYSPRVLALGFVALFVVIGLSVFFVAFRGGATGRAQSPQDRRRKMGKPVILALVVVFVGFGVVIPALALEHNANDQAEAAIGGVELNTAQEHGRELFKERCATCHTLEDAGSVGMVGPDLDNLRPNAELTLDAIAKGRARGQGQMPSMLLTGPDARDVADYVATVSGR